MMSAIKADAILLASGAHMAYRRTLHQIPAFQANLEYIRGLGYEIRYGWGLMLPIGYDAGRHEDGHAQLVYYPESHPARLIADDEAFEAKRGRVIYIPKRCPHAIEAVTDRPRFSIVWVE